MKTQPEPFNTESLSINTEPLYGTSSTIPTKFTLMHIEFINNKKINLEEEDDDEEDLSPN